MQNLGSFSHYQNHNVALMFTRSILALAEEVVEVYVLHTWLHLRLSHGETETRILSYLDMSV